MPSKDSNGQLPRAMGKIDSGVSRDMPQGGKLFQELDTKMRERVLFEKLLRMVTMKPKCRCFNSEVS